MRSEEVNGVVIQYPDAVSFCFNTMPVLVKGYGGTYINVAITNNNTLKTVTEKRNLFGGDCFFDLSYYVRSLFLTDTIGDTSGNDAMTMVEYSVSVMLFNGATQEGSLIFDTHVVWGSLGMGEVFDKYSRLKYYRNLPFTFSVYYPYENAARMEVYADGTKVLDFNSSRGIKNFNPSQFGYPDKVEFKTEDKTITYIADDCTDGVYLRWLDRQGFIRYWLFKRGASSYEVKDALDVRRSDMQGHTERRISKAENAMFKACAPLVDGDTFDMLRELATSPLVDMYIGKDEDDVPQWLAVNVKSDTIEKTRETLQDFEITILLPETRLQSI